MNLLQNVSLKLYSTMRLGGTAKYVAEVYTEDDVEEALTWAHSFKVPVMVVGGGSNIVWRDEGFDGLLIVNKISGFTAHGTELTIGAGENWDHAVERAVELGFSGIECLSLIPGCAGATPVQNVEAYGQQIADTLISLVAYDIAEQTRVIIENKDCAFGYRSSRFKTTDKGKFIITSITLNLSHEPTAPPFHQGLQSYIDELGITDFSPLSLRNSVIAIRSAKLPDPAKIANNGSFFTNPIIEKEKFDKLLAEFPDIHNYPLKDSKFKIPARWLIENAGFKDVHDEETGMATWPLQSLVLVNEHAQTTADLLKFKQKIIDAVKTKYDISLEQEPELLP